MPDGVEMVDVKANLEQVKGRIAAACRRVGRDPAGVLLIAVSKTVDLERIRDSIEAGVAALGENRVQEAREKVAVLGRRVPWHLIGSLQTNKAKDAVDLANTLTSPTQKQKALSAIAEGRNRD